MDDNDFVIMDALFAEVKRLNADLQEEDAKEAPEGDETMEIKELIQALRADAEWAHANEWETPITLGDHLDASADLIESLTAQLTESQRKEKADAELIRKIYFATDEDLCDCCRKIVRMIEAWWNDDEKGEAE